MKRPPFIKAGIALWLSLLPAIPALGQSLSSPTSVVNTNPSTWTFTSNGYATGSVTSTLTPPPGGSLPFSSGYDVNVTATNGASVTVTAPANTSVPAVAAGDALVATIWYQRVDATNGEANLTGSFNTPSTSTASLVQPLRGRQGWRSVNIPFISATNGFSQFTVQYGASTQHVVIGGIQVMDYGPQGMLSTARNAIDCSSSSSVNIVSNGQAAGYYRPSQKPYTVTGNPFFSTGWQVDVSSSNQTMLNESYGYMFFLQCIPQEPIQQGDTLVAIFWMALSGSSPYVATDMGVSGYDFGLITSAGGKQPPYSGAYDQLQVDTNWKQFRIPFTASQAYASGTAQFRIWTDANVQILNISGIQIIDLGNPSNGGGVAASTLTNNTYDYPGRNLSDSWRATALANIQQNRTGTLTVKVEDSNGNPITTGVQLTGSMIKQQFGFGTWENAQYFDDFNGSGGSSITSNYQQALSQYPITGATNNVRTAFNKVDDGAYKWPKWLTAGLTGTGAGSLWTQNEWLRLHNTTDIRGHNLIWPNYGNGGVDVPSWLPSLSGSALITGTVMNHIYAEVSDTTTMSRIVDWDVVNEPYTSFDIQKEILYGTSGGTRPAAATSGTILSTWIQQANTYDPNANLFINDDGAEENVGRFALTFVQNTSSHYELNNEELYDSLLMQYLVANSPIDGFCFESHFGTAAASAAAIAPVTVKQVFDDFGALTAKSGVPLVEQVTEFEDEVPDQNVQADFLADYLTLVFSEPNFNAFCMYGFWGGDFPEPATWNGNTPMTTLSGGTFGNIYDSKWYLTLPGEEWMDLIYSAWWTNRTVTSDSTGTGTINGAFLGRYAITGTYNGMTKTVYADLTKTSVSPNGSTVVLKFSGASAKHAWVYDAANSGAFYPDFNLAANAGAQNGECITTTTRIPFPPVRPTQDLRIDTEATGSLTVWLRVTLENTYNSSPDNRLYVQYDTGSWDLPAAWGTYDILQNYSTFTWVKLGTTTLSPVNEAHTINISESSLWYGNNIDQVMVTDDSTYQP